MIVLIWIHLQSIFSVNWLIFSLLSVRKKLKIFSPKSPKASCQMCCCVKVSSQRHETEKISLYLTLVFLFKSADWLIDNKNNLFPPFLTETFFWRRSYNITALNMFKPTNSPQLINQLITAALHSDSAACLIYNLWTSWSFQLWICLTQLPLNVFHPLNKLILMCLRAPEYMTVTC